MVAALIVRGWRSAVAATPPAGYRCCATLSWPKPFTLLCISSPALTGKSKDLARETGTSRSVFAERFSTTRALSYCMRLAVHISDEGQTLEKVAFRLGYSSLAAFSRAFKRITGKAPGRPWRDGAVTRRSSHLGYALLFFCQFAHGLSPALAYWRSLNRRGSRYRGLQLLLRATAFAVKFEARFDARVALKTVDLDPFCQLGPAILCHRALSKASRVTP